MVVKGLASTGLNRGMNLFSYFPDEIYFNPSEEILAFAMRIRNRPAALTFQMLQLTNSSQIMVTYSIWDSSKR